jgi:SAM-dependent methyltransferase
MQSTEGKVVKRSMLDATLKSIYALVPSPVRSFIWRWRHPDSRLAGKLGGRVRAAVEGFLEGIAAEGILVGTVLEVGAGGRVGNKNRFAAKTRCYWRSDLSPWPNSPPLDIYCDCTCMPFKPGALDGIICSEVLEHIEDVCKAIAEMSLALRPGGYLLITVPFFYPLHGVNKEDYGDFWRFTPGNLKVLFRNHFDLVRLNTTHLFHPGDAFVIDIQMLLRRNAQCLLGVQASEPSFEN